MTQQNNTPYLYPYMLPNGQVAYSPYPVQPQQPMMAPTAPAANYRQSNTRTHLLTGMVAGAAITYLLTNRQVQKGISNTAGKVWGTVRGEMEEMKERLADLQAELEYYRSQEQDNQ
ncbi:YtxH domain-containing protein [Shimwellia pseudoproteus]|uniref:YtxH domain-containing protein n=1 Tax=Shimwellia pseudoproteus TaxID=570012 RepID=UPI0018EAE127|nr:YtxH domain-containing protein [Shimwellia pseudoproteus]MBJ3814620.1 YtxH domain-containing protein [Shimwellia pseudoproteus]